MSGQTILHAFPHLFDGIGQVKGKEIKLHISNTVTPKQQLQRRIPFHVRKDVEQELKRLEQLDIIEAIDGSTPWVSPIVVVPKKSANKAIGREKHLMPTLDDLIADLNVAAVFSTLDLVSGYHQLTLAPESRHITTFSAHVGLRRYKRLMFGINAASEIFQNAIAELLAALPGCKNISDDIIVYGKDQLEHDLNLQAVLQRLSDYNVRLNEDKCHFSQSQVCFYGHIFSAKGVQADPAKIDSIQQARAPQNVSEVKSLLNCGNGRPTNKRPSTKQANQKIVDASLVGLAALLVQTGKVISYASRASSDVESRYSQTEREMLAVVWGVEHFHLYVYVNFINETENLAELYANYVCSNAIPKAMTREEVKLETKLDPLLQKVVTAISLNNWTKLSVTKLSSVEIVLFSHSPCTIEPSTSTQGTSSPPEPLKPSPLPEKAWTNVAVDFVGPFPTGEYLIVVIDDYSLYPEVEILTTTSAKAAIPKLDAIFSRQGIPEILKSDIMALHLMVKSSRTLPTTLVLSTVR
ncbi:Retrovirus-related Pol poly [Paramuricea clavata]|uniref:Retrovirus-related Pol poly n=1 Tax=Paramuricea clavata TaxID=317549 RepID=A0A6S7LD04_PARCT|nr:Retrovirus-related Pol poly [Paramuricea clavata]